MKLYVVQNKAGKFFRPHGQGGWQNQWQTSLDMAKFYTKFGHAQRQCSYWYGHDPKYGCPCVLEFDISPEKANVIDMLPYAEAAAKRKLDKETKRNAKQAVFEAERAITSVKQILERLTPEQRASLLHS